MQANATKDVVDDAVEKMFAEAKAVDEAEDATFEEARGDEPPAALRGREDRRGCFKAAKEILDLELDAERSAHEDHLAERAREEQRQGRKLRGRKPKAPGEKSGYKDKKVNTTDPESKVMSTKNGFLQGYNAQAVANEDQVIVCAEVTDEQNDRRDQRVA
jgi:ribosomal protein L23